MHLACEQASNLLTKVLEWGRLMSYLEQSTRYIAYDARLGGRYRFFRDRRRCCSRRSAPATSATWTACSTPTPSCCRCSCDHFREPSPKDADDSDFVYRQAIRAKAFDALRGILPAASLSNVGIYGTGQGYEQLLLRMRAHPLPEARAYADLMLTELRKVIPSFLKRVDLDDRGVAWSDYLDDDPRRHGGRRRPAVPGGHRRPTTAPVGDPRRLRPRRRGQAGRRMLYPYLPPARGADRGPGAGMGIDDRLAVLRAYVGRAHQPAPQARPGARAAVLPLRRPRRLRRLPRPPAPPHAHHRVAAPHPAHGYTRPEAVDDAGADRPLRRGHGPLGGALRGAVRAVPRPGVLRRRRWPTGSASSMQMNAREAMHLIELRTTPQGHPAYRLVAQEMHRLIAEEAGHRAVAEMMRFVDHSRRARARTARGGTAGREPASNGRLSRLEEALDRAISSAGEALPVDERVESGPANLPIDPPHPRRQTCSPAMTPRTPWLTRPIDDEDFDEAGLDEELDADEIDEDDLVEDLDEAAEADVLPARTTRPLPSSWRRKKKSRRPARAKGEDDDEEEADPDDVEADLDAILKDRIAAADDEDDDEDEVVPEPRTAAEVAEGVTPKKANEFMCTGCFLLVNPGQFGARSHDLPGRRGRVPRHRAHRGEGQVAVPDDEPTPGHDPVERLLDLCVFAPLGFVTDARRVVPELAERGRQQAAVARMVGEFAVTWGNTTPAGGGRPGPGERRRPAPAARCGLSGAAAGPRRTRSAPESEAAGDVRRTTPTSTPARLTEPDRATPTVRPRPTPGATGTTRSSTEGTEPPWARSAPTPRMRPTWPSPTTTTSRPPRWCRDSTGSRRPSSRRSAATNGPSATARRSSTGSPSSRTARPSARTHGRRTTGDTGRSGPSSSGSPPRPSPSCCRSGAAPCGPAPSVDDLRTGTVWRRRSTTRTRWCCAARSTSAVVGYAVVRLDQVADGGHLAVVDDLFTEPGARSVGVGEALLDQVVAWANEQGSDRAATRSCCREPAASKNFFETFGLRARALVVHRDLP